MFRPTPVATVPTIGDAIEALGNFCEELADTLKTISDLSAEISSRDFIRADNIQDIVAVPDPSLLDSLNMHQKQSLISRELVRWRTAARGRAQVTLTSLEMMLLLLWRHLAFYAEGRHINNPDLKGSISHTMRFTSSPDAESLREEAGRRLAPLLQRLLGLDLTEETLERDWQSYRSYIEIMSRRLKDTAGLEEEQVDGAQNGL